MKTYTVYYNTEHGSTYLVPNHYSHTLNYIEETLEYVKEIGLTVPKNKNDIRVEVLRGIKHKGMLLVEFNSKTPPNIDFIDLNEFPNMSEYLVY